MVKYFLCSYKCTAPNGQSVWKSFNKLTNF